MTSFEVFEALTADGRAGQMLEQGVGNYYVTDPVERTHFETFVRRLPPGGRVLVAGCGDGAETVLLARMGFDVTGFDFSPNMVAATGAALAADGLTAGLRVADVTRLEPADWHPPYDGVIFAQVAQFIEDDESLQRAIMDLARMVTPGGSLLVSTTRYPDPSHERAWVLDGETVGTTVYHGRTLRALKWMAWQAGLEVSVTQWYDSAADIPGSTYQNQYLLCRRP